METIKEDTNKEISDLIKKRLSELGISQYRFINSTAIDVTNKQTLIRILRGKGSTRYDTVKRYLSLLGIEIHFKTTKSVEKTLADLNIKPKHQLK